MIDLLKNKKIKEFNKDKADPEKENEVQEGADIPEIPNTKNKININRYKDSEGLTVTKMNFGLWFIEKKPLFIKTFYLILIIIGAITWSRFFFTFGKYYFYDMRRDKEILNDFVATGSVDHDQVLRQMPKALVVGETNVFNLHDETYDFSTEVTNLNSKYYFLLTYLIDYNNGQTREERAVVLPNETKHLIISGEKISSKPKNPSLVFKEKDFERVNLQEINDYESFKEDRLDFSFSDKKIAQGKSSGLSEDLTLNSVEFIAENKSAFNFWQVPLNILFYSNSRLLGVKNYTIEQFLSEERQDINIVIPGTMPTVRDIEIELNLNIFDKTNYMDFTSQGGGGGYE